MNLKTRIRCGEQLVGTFLKTPHPHVAEVLAGPGIDLLCIDAEHAPFDRGDIDACVAAARAGNLATVVRVGDGSAHAILNALDCGADGVVVPHVRSAEQAKALVDAAHFGPGGRGYAGSTRAAGYGTIGIAAHREASARGTVLIAQIEDLDAIQDIDQIAAVEGVDLLFVGRIDLTVALGLQDPDDPAVVEACERIVSAAVKAGRSVGMFLPRPQDARHWRSLGVSMFLLGSDHGFIRAGAKALRSDAGLQ